jgi:hypothetical protein
MPFNGNLKNYGLHSSNINTNGTSYCNGKVTSKAYNFIANKTYIKINNTTTFLNQSSKISIAFWAKLDSVSNDAKKYHTLFCCRSNVGNGVSVFYNPVDPLKGFRFDTGHDH